MEEYIKFHEEPDIPHSDLVSFLSDRAMHVRDQRRFARIKPSPVKESKPHTNAFPVTKREVNLTNYVNSPGINEQIALFMMSVTGKIVKQLVNLTTFLKKNVMGYQKNSVSSHNEKE